MPKKIIVLFVVMFFAIFGFLFFYRLQYCPFRSSPSVIEEKTMTVTIYFGNSQFNPNIEDCRLVYPVEREVTETAGVAKAALTELFKGPNEQEKEKNYVSMFSDKTKDILISVKVEDGTAYVNLKDVSQIMPNAGASCGSAAFLSEMETTLKQFSTIDRVIFAINGEPESFYNFIQMGCSQEDDYCDPAPFKPNNSSSL